jgi:hypothetical protein
MSHFAINQLSTNIPTTSASAWNYFPSRFLPISLPFKMVAIFLLFIGVVCQTNAQICALTCVVNSNVYIDADCAIHVMPDQILNGVQPCPGPYTLVLRRANGVIVPNNDLNASFVGQTLMATVTHTASTNQCMGNITIKDTLDPQITCSNISVFCNQSLLPTTLTQPTISDNCGGSVALTYSDAPALNGACATNFIKKITRTWTASDIVGNTSTCSQVITVTRPTLANVTFPATTVTIATGVVANPTLTGVPTINGSPLVMACNLSAFHKNIDTIITCRQSGLTVEYKINRVWAVINHCTNDTTRFNQTILVKDMVAPTITCPTNFTVNTVVNDCFGMIASLPLPTVSNNDSISVSSALGDGFGPWDNISVGVLDVKYKVHDCSHVDSCITKVTIKDNQKPTLMLSSNKIVSLSSSGTVTMPASMFNVASYDNCDDVKVEVSRNGVLFGNSVTFSCSDVGSQVMVTVKVSEVGNPDNFAIGMVGVTPQDKMGPDLSSANTPPDFTINCNLDYQHPTMTPINPIFTDNCGIDTVIFTTINNVTSCGVGTFLRKFTAYDIHGNSSVFVQTITVTNPVLFSASNITWPTDFVTTTCGANLDPSSMIAPYKEPTVVNQGCATIAVNYTDQFFNVAAPACSKILRKWTVIDWCQYNPMLPNAGGRWQHTQILAIMDNIAPTLAVPTDITASIGGNCLTGVVTLNPAVTTDCSPLVSVVHNSQYATAPGANASGNYPNGIHLITFKASDACGNTTIKTTKVTVTDNVAPTPVCMNGLSANLTQMTNGLMTMINATAFNQNSTDNCTSNAQLKFKIKKSNLAAVPTDQLTFDCSEKGLQLVQMHVTDLKGNTSFCQTYILIQDNMNMCPAPTNANVAGAIQTEMGEKIENVTVQVPNYNNALPVNTNAIGAFAIPNLPMHGNYDIKPTKDGDDINGVSTYDISLLSKHLLGVQSLNSPYKIIAADVNKSGTVTTFDVIELRKLILGVYDQLPTTDSWRFVDKNYVFANPSNPFTGGFPEIKTFQNLSADSNAQFIGIKVGDLNSNAQTNNLQASDERDAVSAFGMNTNDQEVENGEAFAVSLKATNRQEIIGLSFTLEFDPKKVTFEDWAPGVLPDMGAANVSFYRVDEGKITVCWSDIEGTEVAPNQSVLMLQGRAMENTLLSDALRFSSRPTRAEAFGPDGESMEVTLHFNRADGSVVPASSVYELYQNQPNPFNNSTLIGFHLPENKEVKISIFDAAGRLVVEKTQNFDKGYNEWTISGAELSTQGVYSYRVSTDDWTSTRKMVKQ